MSNKYQNDSGTGRSSNGGDDLGFMSKSLSLNLKKQSSLENNTSLSFGAMILEEGKNHISPTTSDNRLVVDEDDDTEKDGVPVLPGLFWEDRELSSASLKTLNQMRKEKHFCDITLQVDKQDLPAHRAVLAATSPYFFELFTSKNEKPSRKEEEVTSGMLYSLNGGFDKRSLEVLVDYAYTARLDISAADVQSVFVTACKLRMDRVVRECSRYLVQTINVENCFELRNASAMTSFADLTFSLDSFIEERIEKLYASRPVMSLPRINVEILHLSKEERDVVQFRALADLILDWIRNRFFGVEPDDAAADLQSLVSRKRMLFMDIKKNSLEDAAEIADGSADDSEIVQDYKKYCTSNGGSNIKGKDRKSQPAKPRELLFSRQINHREDGARTGNEVNSWKVIAVHKIDDQSGTAIFSIAGQICSVSIIQRINRPTDAESIKSRKSSGELGYGGRHPAGILMSSGSNEVTLRVKLDPQTPCESVTDIDGGGSDGNSRAESADIEDMFRPIANMAESKCAVGAACLANQLIVCGGYDRGECLDKVAAFSVEHNSWSTVEPMLKKRGRFDITVLEGKIYAVAGSNGHSEEATCEVYDSKARKWTFLPSLPVPVSNIALSNINGAVYCIGGTFGQSGNKHCFKLTVGGSKWERITSLSIGRSQAAAAVYNGKIWVVGGCDAWNPLASTEIYDPCTDSWQMGPPMSTPRRGCGLVEKNGMLFAVGGSDGSQSLCTTELYDAKTNLWTAGPNMTTCRANVSAAVVGDKIWAVGGFSGKAFLNTVEFLDLKREEWTTYLPNNKYIWEVVQENNGNLAVESEGKATDIQNGTVENEEKVEVEEKATDTVIENCAIVNGGRAETERISEEVKEESQIIPPIRSDVEGTEV